jgi:hypothetical protein
MLDSPEYGGLGFAYWFVDIPAFVEKQFKNVPHPPFVASKA